MRAILLSALVAMTVLAGCSAQNPAEDVNDAPPAPVERVRAVLDETISYALPTILGHVTGGAEPSVAVGPDGEAYVTTPLALWRSLDGGKTWETVGAASCLTAPAGCPTGYSYAPGMKGAGDADIWVTPDGRLHWLGLFDGDNAIPYQYSDDMGDTWTAVNDLAGDDSGDREWITGRADGTLFAAWRNFPSQGDAKIVMRASYDGGETWTGRTDIAPDTRQGGIAVDPSSDALALAHDRAGRVSVAHSFDNGTTWESVAVVEDPVMGHVFPVTAFDSMGNLYVAYAHDKAPSPAADLGGRPMELPKVYMHVSKDKGLTWGPAVQISAPGATAWFPWIAAGGPGRVVITWYQNDEGYPRQVGGNVYVMSGISVDADYEDAKWSLNRVAPDPIHTGPECRENPGACTRSLLDFFEVAIHPDGYPVITWAEDTYPIRGDRIGVTMMTSGPDLLDGARAVSPVPA